MYWSNDTSGIGGANIYRLRKVDPEIRIARFGVIFTP